MLANTGQKFVVTPTFSLEKLATTLAEYEAHLKDKYSHGKRQLSRHLRERLIVFSSVKTIEQFGAALDSFLKSPADKADYDNKARQTDFLTRLWQNGCLIWPPVYSAEYNFSVTCAWGFDAKIQRFLEDLTALQSPDVDSGRTRVRAVIMLLLARSGGRSAGDLTPDVAGRFFVDQMRPKGLRLSTVTDLLKLQSFTHGDAVQHRITDYGRVGRFAERSDDNFDWALAQDPTLAEWVTVSQDYMGSVKRNLLTSRSGVNKFLDYLVANKAVTRQPVEYLRAGYQPPAKLDRLHLKTSNGLHYFFERILDTRCVAEDDYGNKVRLVGYRNPIDFIPNPKLAAETLRNPMPTRFVRMLHDILIENNFAWAKAYGVSNWNRKGGDMCQWLNPDTMTEEEVWSPVRAIAILIKLFLPSRTYQIRMLDSGEADTEVYRPEQGGWIGNSSKLTGNKISIRKGVFCRHHDQSGKEFVFLRFNTNKTADIDVSPEDTGYIMPWEHQGAIRLLTYLRDWQEKFNPLIAPTKWEDIKDINVSARFSKNYLERKGTACFLFRDACSPYKDQPVTDSRLNTFWRNLNAELERRLIEAGESMPDGSPIKLVERLENGGVGPSVFDLHTLRVTIITALAESGGVPIDVLMKVVGHASIIMTLYYTKLSPTHICERLNEGELQVHNAEQRNWQHWLTQQSREVLLKAAAYTAPTAVDALAKISPSSWVIRDHGMCPVGCTRCHDGGPVVVDTNAYQKFAPVPGSASNCVLCRFFITGPAFLLGLQAYFDNTGYRLREASEKYQAAKNRFETLEGEYNLARGQGSPISKQQVQQLDIAASHLDQQTLKVDDLAHSWHATYRLIEQCLAILRNNQAHQGKSTPGYALVAVGGLENLEAVIEESSDFELIDRVCQSAVFFEGLDATLPNLKRMRAFDAMLKRNGYAPIFVELTEQDALAVGNQLAAFLYARFGREKANALLAGKETLQRLGIEKEVIHKLASVSPVRIQRQSENQAIANVIRQPGLSAPKENIYE
jgi:hypothetical protein